jgi:hypothetical protein
MQRKPAALTLSQCARTFRIGAAPLTDFAHFRARSAGIKPLAQAVIASCYMRVPSGAFARSRQITPHQF